MRSPSLSVVMMVGNELIDGMLELSLRQSSRVADEIVCWCNGTDGSDAVCAANGARVVRGQWIGDHGWARNRSIAEARTDWILVIDCDELIDDAFIAQWPKFLVPEADGYALPTYQFVKPPGQSLGIHRADGWYPDWHTRLFANQPNIYYRRAWDEELCGCMSVCHLPEIHIYHYGWCRDAAFRGAGLEKRNAAERQGGKPGQHTLAEPYGDCQPFTGSHPDLWRESALRPVGCH